MAYDSSNDMKRLMGLIGESGLPREMRDRLSETPHHQTIEQGMRQLSEEIFDEYFSQAIQEAQRKRSRIYRFSA